MDLNQFSNIFSGQNIFNLFFKVFVVVFSLLYLIYSLVILKQTSVMTKTLESEGNTFIRPISLLQIFIGVILLLVSLLLI